ncbi:hypothetical protein CI610_03308 [invertebrate metagenome]|uniref:Uncharacterized protein n=1 Tax=invertebrate metagenome TaxID=1711999 RepID=A0A2H9T3G4_9ZZZZ
MTYYQTIKQNTSGVRITAVFMFELLQSIVLLPKFNSRIVFDPFSYYSLHCGSCYSFQPQSIHIGSHFCFRICHNICIFSILH